MPLATAVVAVVVSHGRNGRGAYTIGGTRNTLPTAGTDEEANAIGGRLLTPTGGCWLGGPASCLVYYRRELTTDDAAIGGPFDDQLLILTANDLLEPLFRDGSLRPPAAIANDTLQKVKLAAIGHSMGFVSTYGESDCTINAPPKQKCRMVVSADTADGGAEMGNNDGLVPFVTIGIPLAEALDPWGMRYRYKPNLAVITNASGYGISSIVPAANTIAMQIYSQGPNRTDDGGLADDISISVAVSEVRGYMANLLP